MQVLKMPEETPRAAATSLLIHQLLGRLDKAEVNYCHWKSNWRIDRWLEGDGDLDLLVCREDISKFTIALYELGFKKTLSKPAAEMPGILNFYGYDACRQRFIHIHAHYQLVFGHDLTKNYRLPIERDLLWSAVRKGEIVVASPEAELIIFVIRMVLKFSMAESLARLAVGRSRGHTSEIQNELGHLSSQVDSLKLKALLHRQFTMIDERIFDRCVRSLGPNVGVFQKLLAKQRLESALSAYARTSRTVEATTRIKRRTLFLANKFLLRKRNMKKFENGGFSVALVGGDGAGKTTCVNEIYGWMSRKFETRRFHLGKPSKSLLTKIVATGLKLKLRLAGVTSSYPDSSEAASTGGVFQYLRWVCVARDRYRLYKKIRRSTANGCIVICDRYPMPNLLLMDGPKIRTLASELRGTYYGRWLSALEDGYYRQILPPDLTFVLRVEPHTAVDRKTNERRIHVFSRSKELWSCNWQDTPAVRLINAERPLNEVLEELRFALWESI